MKRRKESMAKLNQILAIADGVKSQTTRVETDLYHNLDKKQLFSGLSRTYQPLRVGDDGDGGDQLPPEFTMVQLKSEEILKQLTTALTRWVDITATKDAANTFAKSNVVVDGQVIAADVPVTTLLFLEKELEKLAAFIGRLPVLDPAQNWSYDPARGVFAAETVQTMRTKKVPRNHVLYEATEQHPAQVTVFNEDISIGTWSKTDFSGALKADRVTGISSRLEKLRTAVKFAREEANAIEVNDVHYGESILDFLFEGGQ